jgi:hypothetical protein
MVLTILTGIKKWFPKLGVKVLQETEFRESNLEEWRKEDLYLNSRGKPFIPAAWFVQIRFSLWQKKLSYGALWTCPVTFTISFDPHSFTILRHHLYRVSQEERSIFWEIIVSVILRKKVYMNMCPIPNGFRDRALWMYSCKIIDRKAILRTVSNIHCSSGKFVNS